MLFTQDLKRAFLDELSHGLAREAYAQRQFFPVGGGMSPLDRRWDEEALVGLGLALAAVLSRTRDRRACAC
jgi:hypothetical protein